MGIEEHDDAVVLFYLEIEEILRFIADVNFSSFL